MGEQMSLGQGTENAIFVDVVFWVIAASSVLCAIVVVQSKDLFRSAMFLIVSFLSVAGLFVLLRAEFLAAVQVLIYVGAIAVLLLFAILMTRDVESGNPSNRQIVPVGVLAALFGAAAIFVAIFTEWTILFRVSCCRIFAVKATGESISSAISVTLTRLPSKDCSAM